MIHGTRAAVSMLLGSGSPAKYLVDKLVVNGENLGVDSEFVVTNDADGPTSSVGLSGAMCYALL